MIRISLVIPTHNRAAQMVVALHSVVRQSLPADEWECIVVANNCTDNTMAEFSEFAAANPACRLRIVEEPQPGLSHARNRGIAEATAPLVAFIDDDERVNADFLRTYADFFDTHAGAVAAGGRIIAEYPEGRPAWMSHLTEIPIANPMDFGSEIREFPRGRIPGGGNMAFRREVLVQHGGFDPQLGRVGGKLIGGEESDLFERICRDGTRPWYLPDAVMWHIIPSEKLTDDYFRRLCRNVGVSQRRRTELHGGRLRLWVGEAAKWIATLLLVLVHRPAQTCRLFVMRYHISRGIFSGE